MIRNKSSGSALHAQCVTFCPRRGRPSIIQSKTKSALGFIILEQRRDMSPSTGTAKATANFSRLITLVFPSRTQNKNYKTCSITQPSYHEYSFLLPGRTFRREQSPVPELHLHTNDGPQSKVNKSDRHCRQTVTSIISGHLEDVDVCQDV